MALGLKPVLTSAPSGNPVTLTEAKLHLRVDHSTDDDLITALIGAATANLDGWYGILGRCLLTQTWRSDFPEFPAGDELRLPLSPVQSVIVSYYDADAGLQTFSSTKYRLIEDHAGPVISLNDNESWPDTDIRPAAVSVAAVCGYGAAAVVPDPIKTAIKVMVAAMYETRAAVTPPYPAHLLENYRRVQAA